jgi:hypothetical protein
MARYKYGEYLTQSDHEIYDEIHKPGATVPHSGIYRCNACGDEIASNKGDPFPPQNHHQHTSGSPIRWQLLVRSVQKK